MSDEGIFDNLNEPKPIVYCLLCKKAMHSVSLEDDNEMMCLITDCLLYECAMPRAAVEAINSLLAAKEKME